MSKHIFSLLFSLAVILSSSMVVEAKVAPVEDQEAVIDINVKGDIRTVDGTYMNDEARKTLNAVNDLRAQKGLEPLVWASDFDELGMLRAAEIQEFYSHARPNGEPRVIVKDGRIIVTGENIAAGYENAEEVMSGWTNSPGHYANMTNKKYHSYYCACFVTYDSNGWPWYTWVQLFSFDKLGTDEDTVYESISEKQEILQDSSSNSSSGPSDIIDLSGNSSDEEKDVYLFNTVYEEGVTKNTTKNTVIEGAVTTDEKKTEITEEGVVVNEGEDNTQTFETIVVDTEKDSQTTEETVVLDEKEKTTGSSTTESTVVASDTETKTTELPVVVKEPETKTVENAVVIPQKTTENVVKEEAIVIKDKEAVVTEEPVS